MPGLAALVSRSSMVIARLLGCALAAATLASCSDPDSIIETRYGAYEGDAYPDRRPEIAIPDGGMGVVTDSLSDTISLIALETGERFGVRPVGRDPVTIDGPRRVAVDAAGGALYIALSYPDIDGASGPHAVHGGSAVAGYVQKLALDDLRILGQVRVEANPGDIAISEDGARVVVSHFDLRRALDNAEDLEAARSSLAVVDPDAVSLHGSPEPTLIPVCKAAHGIALSRPDGARAYVACFGEDALAIVDLTDPDAEVKLVPVGPPLSPGEHASGYGPYAVAMSPDQKTIAVSNTERRDVRFFDVASETFDESRTILTIGAPYVGAWAADGSALYVPTQVPDTIARIGMTPDDSDAFSRNLSGECPRPHLAALDEEHGLFLVCEGDRTATPGKVLRLDPETLETRSEAEVGLYPDAFARVAARAR
ncbi:YncE family protein [Sorangium sp. So ce119]|uniref:YncE family protein n=1 Tax=Sorangium sp. So ce119 TaxID=3133279 RepID=UPI003F5D833A